MAKTLSSSVIDDSPKNRSSSKHFDLQSVKRAAQGKWRTLANQVIGIPDDYLTTTRQGCPKCKKGTDRFFVFDDFDETGGAMCNQCGKSGDGFALAQWFRGWSLDESIRHVAEYLELKPAKSKGSKPSRSTPSQAAKKSGSNPREPKTSQLEFLPWRDRLFDSFEAAKKPITKEAVQLVGGRFAKHFGTVVIAIPIIDEDGSENGYAVYNATGGTIPYRETKESPYQQLKIKKVDHDGGNSGLVGRIVKGQPILKVEGESDVLAVLSINLNASVVTNLSGADEKPKAWILKKFRRQVVYVIPDIDEVGRAGGTKWADAIAKVAKEVRIIKLKFEGKGKDVRDFINERLSNGMNREQAFDALMQCEFESVKCDPANAGYDDDGADAGDDGSQEDEKPILTNYEVKYVDDGNGNDKRVNEPIELADMLTTVKVLTGGLKKCGNDLFAIINKEPRKLGKPSQLFAMIHELGQVDWAQGGRLMSREEFFEACKTHAEIITGFENYPHFPAREGVHYLCDEVEPGDGSTLEKFVSFFSPAYSIDRQLIYAAIASAFWGGPYGQIPGFNIEGTKGQGTGKTTFVQKIGLLTDGVIDIDQNVTREDLASKLLNGNVLSRLLLVDNVKVTRLSSIALESFITAKEITGKALYFGTVSKPNRYIVFLTFNSPSLSRDLAQRMVTLKLSNPNRSPSWSSDVDRFVRENRQKIIGDVRAFFNREPKPIKPELRNRWALWQQEIIGRLEDPNGILNELHIREKSNDSDEKIANQIYESVWSILENYSYVFPCRVHMSNTTIAKAVSEAVGEPQTVKAANLLIERLRSFGFLQHLEINSSHKFGKGWVFSLGVEQEPKIAIDYDLAARMEARRIEAERQKVMQDERAKQEVLQGSSDRKPY